MPFAAEAFESDSFILKLRDTDIYTSDSSYWLPQKVRVEVYDNLGETLLMSYDSFQPEENDIILLDCEISIGSSQTSFMIKWEDGSGTIDQNTVGLGNKVLVYMGKTSNALTLMFTGYSEKRSPTIRGNNVMDYTMEGYGEMASLNDLIVNFKRASTSLIDVDDIGIPTRPDSKMAVSELVRDLMEDINVRVVKDITVQDYMNLDLSGVDPSVQERLLSISQSMTEVSSVLNFLAEATGGIWRVENGRLIFEYPQIHHSGIIIKSDVDSTDLANRTSYNVNPWTYTDSISKDDGFANRIYTSTTIDTKAVANQSSNQGATSLYGRGIAQQFSAIDSRINTIFLIMSRVGNPFPATESGTDIVNQVVKGEIRIDIEDKPIGPTIALFDIPVSGLTSSADTVFINDIKIDASVLSPTAKYWIVVFPVGTSNGNTIRWHHNNDITVAGANSAFALGNSRTELGTWRVSSFGPTYCFSVFARIRRLQEYSDPQSMQRFRIKEDVVDLPFLDDSVSVAKMMQNVLSYRGKPVRKYNINEVTLPAGLLFTPGMYVTIEDTTGHHETSKNVLAEIQEVRYNWSTDASDKTIGIFKCSILPVGWLNWHSELFPAED
jgi:hypothetical protein